MHSNRFSFQAGNTMMSFWTRTALQDSSCLSRCGGSNRKDKQVWKGQDAHSCARMRRHATAASYREGADTDSASSAQQDAAVLSWLTHLPARWEDLSWRLFRSEEKFLEKMSRVSSAQRRKASSLRLSVAEVSRQRPGWGAAPKVATVTRTAADGGGVWSFGARDWARWETRVHVAPRARSGSSQTQAAVLFKGKCLCIFT